MAAKVSIIIPCRNEEKYIEKCLESVVNSDYKKDQIEVLVVDGMSEDKTREVIQRYCKQYPFVRYFENSGKTIPLAMNTGIRNSSGDIIMKIDSHSIYTPDYISKCVRFLGEYDADNVGGVLTTLPREDTPLGWAIVKAITSPFGVGNSRFRTGEKEPVWADTAYSGCYRRDVFDRFGLYDENIARSEDVAINSRLRKKGGKILLVPEIVTSYYARSDYFGFVKHNFDNGYWITYPLMFGRLLFSWRHIVPLFFVVSAIVAACMTLFAGFGMLRFVPIIAVCVSYAVANVYFSGLTAWNNRDFKLLFLMPVIFTTLHIVYGFGSLWGLSRVFASHAISIFNRRAYCHGD